MILCSPIFVSNHRQEIATIVHHTWSLATKQILIFHSHTNRHVSFQERMEKRPVRNGNSPRLCMCALELITIRFFIDTNKYRQRTSKRTRLLFCFVYFFFFPLRSRTYSFSFLGTIYFGWNGAGCTHQFKAEPGAGVAVGFSHSFSLTWLTWLTTLGRRKKIKWKK